MSTLEYLNQIKELISDETHWTTGVLARRADGTECNPGDADACCWCLMGSMIKIVSPAIGIPQYNEVWNVIANARADHEDFTSRPLPIINDTFGFDGVHQLLDSAIKNAQQLSA